MLKTPQMLLTFVFALIATLTATSCQLIVVDTQYGPVLGQTAGAVDQWLGSPFAAPPGWFLRIIIRINQLRFL